MNQGARDENEAMWRRAVLAKLDRNITLLERLVTLLEASTLPISAFLPPADQKEPR